MTYDEYVRLWANESMRSLVGSDPASWTKEIIEEVNKKAREETELYDRLMKLSDKDFYDEVEHLSSI